MPIDHCKIFTPRFNVAAVVAALILASVPLPCANVQVPLSVNPGTATGVLAETDVTEEVTHKV